MVWIHNGTKEFPPTVPFDDFTKCGMLNITSVRYEDSGTYACTIRWRSSSAATASSSSVIGDISNEKPIISREKMIPIQVRGNQRHLRSGTGSAGHGGGGSATSTLLGSVRAVLGSSVDDEEGKTSIDRQASVKQKHHAQLKEPDGLSATPRKSLELTHTWHALWWFPDLSVS